MNNRILHIAAAAASLLALPAVASAQTLGYGNAAPVALESCSFAASGTPRDYDVPLAFGGPLRFHGPQTADTIALGYTNNGNVSATAVRFVLDDGKSTQSVIAKGTFAPGVRIDKSFVAKNNENVASTATCSVAEVRFADGTAWHAVREVANH